MVRQQSDAAAQISQHELVPIIEPELSSKSPDKAAEGAILLAELVSVLDALPDGRQVMLELAIPDVPDHHSALLKYMRMAGVAVLSRNYTRADACRRLAASHGIIASFSRALIGDHRHSISYAEFDGRRQTPSTESIGPLPRRYDSVDRKA